jgi:peptidoglycan/xylan/chitin deacetylase (PgdA/CDA1 family)
MKKLILFLLPLWLLAEAHIFVLHRIDDFRHPYTNTSSKELEKYFEYIKSHNYKAITLSKLAEMIKNRQNVDNIVVFTIDDTYKSFYKNGLPVFKKYGIPFTLFVYVKATNEKWGDFMTWQQVKDAAKYGELGIHSYAHPHLPNLSNQAIINDTKKAIEIFKKHMGYVPDMYAYPYGEYDQRVKKIINSFFPIIANQNPGAVDIATPINDLDRIALTGKVDIAKKLKIKRLHADIKIQREGNKITLIKGKVFDKIPYVNIYITKMGWVYKIPVKNGSFSYAPNFELKKYRNRVIIRYNYKIISKMVIKYKK